MLSKNGGHLYIVTGWLDVAGHVPPEKQISHSHEGGHRGEGTSFLPLQLGNMEVMLKPRAHEAAVNQVVTQQPLASCLEAGPG